MTLLKEKSCLKRMYALPEAQEKSTRSPKPVCLKDVKNYVILKVGPQGGWCINSKLGIVLDVPEGAVIEETVIYLGEAIKQSTTISLHELSPEIVCLPHDLQFKQSVFLTFQHSWTPLHERAQPPLLYTSQGQTEAEWQPIQQALFTMRKVTVELKHFSHFQVVSVNGEKRQARVMKVMVFMQQLDTVLNILLLVNHIDCVQVSNTYI